MIYYTADLHFHYAPLLSSRPFATVAEMDETLIRNWNETVTEADTVYLVGDVGYNDGHVPLGALGRLHEMGPGKSLEDIFLELTGKDMSL